MLNNDFHKVSKYFTDPVRNHLGFMSVFTLADPWWNKSIPHIQNYYFVLLDRPSKLSPEADEIAS